ncbi:CsbD family protein [Leuconostoc pseudomesenteroides]|uniref:CsbD family protein n=1 Tax=Leuconostoc pseudomesenteroides TaxID=33968 RepID=UPI0032DECEC7
MKKFVLGISLFGNVLFGYHLLKEQGMLDDLNKKFDSLSDQIEGKAKQVSGTLTDSSSSKIEGTLQETAGKTKDAVQDIKNKVLE